MVGAVVALFDERRPRHRRLLFRGARGEAEETIRHLKTNLTAHRLDERSYWLLHNRLVTIVKMLDRLMN